MNTISHLGPWEGPTNTLSGKKKSGEKKSAKNTSLVKQKIGEKY